MSNKSSLPTESRKGSPFLEKMKNAPTTPATDQTITLEQQRDKAADPVPASVKEAQAANPKNETAEVVHPEFKKLGIARVYAVNFEKGIARTKDVDSMEAIQELFPDVKFTKDNSPKGGRVFTYDKARLAELVAKSPKRTAKAASIKYTVESSELLGLDGQHYVVCDSVSNVESNGMIVRTFNGVRLTGTWYASSKTGEFMLHRDGRQMSVKMHVIDAITAYPNKFDNNGKALPGNTGKESKMSKDRPVFVIDVKLNNANNEVTDHRAMSYGGTNTINALMRVYDMIVFPEPVKIDDDQPVEKLPDPLYTENI